MQCLVLGIVLLTTASASVPALPREYSVVIQMKMPYIPLEMPLRVLTSSVAQKIEFYDGLEVDVSSAKGTYKYTFNNSRRICSYSPPTAGPTLHIEGASALNRETWSAKPFFPDLSHYSYEGDALVGGIMCQKFTLNAHHGSLGTMDDHLSFYWDAVLGKPVRWHMHSRHVTFGSHTDEYIMDYLSFQSGTPPEADLALPEECEKPQEANISIHVHSFLAVAHAMQRSSKSAESPPALFTTFSNQYGKTHAPKESARRHAVFEHNLHLVQKLNHQHVGRTRFTGNKFLDMTVDEVLRFRGGKTRGSSRIKRRSQEHWQYVRTHSVSDTVSLPTDFDWRTARPGSVSPVKDQAMCGSCWTYGLTEPIESIKAIRTGSLVQLPEQFVVDCTWTNDTGASGCNSGCDGGDSDIGALEIIRKFGGVIPSAAAYGDYLSVNGYCKDIRLMEVGAKITGWVDVPKRGEDALLQAIFTQGPVSVGIMVPEEMLFYDSGVLSVESCRHDESQIDHAVVATGFGTDEHGTAYYTIRNSWSTYWGDKGYIRIARGELDCCVSCEAGYPELTEEAEASGNLVVV
mmetsp:Transcript_100111/g.250948  ORF Transcript_100111/g.250948 Transcript_100111/m.250948 type:complete len:573 (+) Transcript_100111:73-1791(+)